jgi:hypothetical protein
MLISCSEVHARRLAAFDIREPDIAALQRQHHRVAQRLPGLLDRLDQKSTAGPQVTEGLLDDRLKQQRNAYWALIASGQLGDPFVDAAAAFARTSYTKAIPSRAFTIRHSSGARMLVDGLFGQAGSSAGRPWPMGLIKRQLGARHRAEYAGALQKALWLGLSLVLEAYANVEAEQKSLTLAMIETSFSNRISTVADILGGQVVNLETAVVSISTSAGLSIALSELLANDALKASVAVREVVGSADELARSVSEIGGRIARCAQSAGDAAAQARRGMKPSQSLPIAPKLSIR